MILSYPDEEVTLKSCDDPAIYTQCTVVVINMDAVLDDSVAEVALPDGTIVQRNTCDNGEPDLVQRGCAHFNNKDHNANVYLSYSLPYEVGDK